jgi:hypothetical protein
MLTAPRNALRRIGPNDTLLPENRSIDPDRHAMLPHRTAPEPIRFSDLIGALAGT